MDATFGSGRSASKTSSAITTRRLGSSSAAQHESIVVFPDPGAPEKTIESRARTHARRKSATRESSMSRSTSSASDRYATPVNLRMLTSR
jgi:hypothetical protein